MAFQLFHQPREGERPYLESSITTCRDASFYYQPVVISQIEYDFEIVNKLLFLIPERLPRYARQIIEYTLVKATKHTSQLEYGLRLLNL